MSHAQTMCNWIDSHVVHNSIPLYIFYRRVKYAIYTKIQLVKE